MAERFKARVTYFISDIFRVRLSGVCDLESLTPPIATRSKKESGRCGNGRVPRHLPDAHALITYKHKNETFLVMAGVVTR